WGYAELVPRADSIHVREDAWVGVKSLLYPGVCEDWVCSDGRGQNHYGPVYRSAGADCELSPGPRVPETRGCDQGVLLGRDREPTRTQVFAGADSCGAYDQCSYGDRGRDAVYSAIPHVPGDHA